LKLPSDQSNFQFEIYFLVVKQPLVTYYYVTNYLSDKTMVLRFRFLFLLFIHFFKRTIGIMDANMLEFRVLFNDVDIKRMSSDRYLPIMELTLFFKQAF
jgi:hypothetical protein